MLDIAPRWDGRRVHFDMMIADTLVSCAISSAALRELSGQSRYKPADLLRCFVEARPRIEAVAIRLHNAQPSSVSGILSIWEDDVEGEGPPPPAPRSAGEPRPS